jgi:hypothetical protein
MSMTTGIVILVVLLVIIGGGGYAAFNAVKSTTSTSSSCYPPTSVTCLASAPTHDVKLFTPFKSSQVGTHVPFTATLPETASGYSFNFGDGSALANTSSAVATHTYLQPGTFIVSVQANVAGMMHDNYLDLQVITVAASYDAANASNTAPVTGSIVSNSTPINGTAPSAILQPGGSVTVLASYSGEPTNPSFALRSPTIVASSAGKISGLSNTTTSATAQVTFANSGVYTVTYVGSASSSTGVAYLNYTWTVFVAPAGLHASAGTAASATSPHPGDLVWYEEAPGGGRSEDPSISYDTASGELVYNVYQTLISYNGTQAGPNPNDFTPTLTACVPGSPSCTALFGSSLVNASSGAYTFVLSSTPAFYDPANPSANWGVYPTDVMFTFLRTMGFANQPFVASDPGWIVAQSLLPFGNGAWDPAHAPFNNTPQQEASSILVNASGYCPSVAMTGAAYHGCVTFLANGGGTSWPFFLEFVADFEGGGIEPCGWFSAPAQAAGIPLWTAPATGGVLTPEEKANQGDHPCLLPGGVTSTDNPAFKAWLTSTSPTAWDTWEAKGSTAPFLGNVQYAMAGSGAYYLAGLSIGQAYTLKANPNYRQNPFCAIPACEPKPGDYVPTVSVDWESTATPGEQAIQSGEADHAGIPSTDASTLIEDLQNGKVVAVTCPTLNIDAWYFDMQFDETGAHSLTTNPITVPSDFFSYVAAREFFAHAYPYTTIEQTVNTVEGIQYAFNYGGAIPQFMGNYYPTNVSFPTGNAAATATPGSALWWWQQGTTAGSPFYDPELAACTSSSPCQLPFVGENGAPGLDQAIGLFANALKTESNGAVLLSSQDVNFNNLLIYVSSAPGNNPMPIYRLGWAPDYPDPTDYIAPFYEPNQAYTYPDAVAEALAAPAYNQPTYTGGHCYTGTGSAHAMNATDVVNYAKMAESLNGIPTACQGWAYDAMNYQAGVAGAMSPGSARVLAYNFLEQIANGLCLYIYTWQDNVVTTVAPWINPASVNTNIEVLGSEVWDYAHLTGNGLI